MNILKTVAAAAPLALAALIPLPAAALWPPPSGGGARLLAAATPWTTSLGWIESRFEAPDPGGLDGFGATIAVDGDTAFVGAPNRPAVEGGFQGAVYVYTYADGQWTPTQTLTADDAGVGDAFGSSIALQGSTAIIGAPLARVGSVAQAGTAYVFRYDGTQWVQAQKLVADVPGLVADFGDAVALDGANAVIGAHGVFGPNGEASVGAAYVFAESGGTWTQTAKLTASAAHERDLFGVSVGIAGDTIVVGASQATWIDGESGPGPGRVYVYRASSAGWTETGHLVADDGVDGDYFGETLAFDGSTLAIGAPAVSAGGAGYQGAVYVFEPSAEGWQQRVKLAMPGGEESAFFGRALALAGPRLAVGAPGATANDNPFAGAAFLFSAADGSWPQVAQFSPSDGRVGDYLGFAVGVHRSGNVLAGAPHQLDDGLDAPGAVYVYASDRVFADGFDGAAAR